MAIQGVNVGDSVGQVVGAWFDPGADWTYANWVRYDTGNYYSTAWTFYNDVTDSIFIASYGYPDTGLPGQPFVQDIEVGLTPGLGSYYSTEYDQPNPTMWTHIAVVYTVSDQTLRMYVNGVLVVGYQADIVADLSSGGLVNSAFLLSDGVSLEKVSMAYSGLWQTALTAPQIAAQMQSPVPLVSSGLIWFTPLNDASDLSDISGNDHGWTEVFGTIQTVTGPFPLVTMSQLPLEAAYDMAAWRPYVGGGANGWETPAPQTSHGDLARLI